MGGFFRRRIYYIPSTMNKQVYLDYHATTPVDPRVLDAMLPYLKDSFGNASSKTHPYGWAAREAVEKARAQVGSLLNASPGEIYFTGGATGSAQSGACHISHGSDLGTIALPGA